MSDGGGDGRVHMYTCGRRSFARSAAAASLSRAAAPRGLDSHQGPGSVRPAVRDRTVRQQAVMRMSRTPYPQLGPAGGPAPRSRRLCFDRSRCARYAQTLCLGCALAHVRVCNRIGAVAMATAIRAPSCLAAEVRRSDTPDRVGRRSSRLAVQIGTQKPEK